MKDLRWLIRKTLISTFKSYKSWLLYVGIPVVAIFLALMIQTDNSKGQILHMGIVNQDGEKTITQDAIAFIERLDSVEISEVDEAEINTLVASGDIDAAIVFPAGFAESLAHGEPEAVQIVSAQGAAVTGYVKAYLNPYIDNIALIGLTSAGDKTRFTELYTNYQEASFQLSVEKVEDRSVDFAVARQTIGYLIIIMLFGAATLSGIMIKEREERTFHRIIASAVLPRTYVMANIAVNLFIMILQIILTLMLMHFVLKIDPGISYLLLFALLALFALVAVSLSLAIVAFSSNYQMATALQSAVFFPTSILAGCMFPIETLPAALQSIASILPQYWLLGTFSELQQGSTLGSLSANLLILVAFAAALSLIAAYKVGRNNDVRSYT
jgi:ABC-2 type transport system permease protein